MNCRVAIGFCAAASSAVLFVSPKAGAGPPRTPVAVLPLDFAGDLVGADRAVLSQRLVLGLKATELEVISGDSVERALGGRSAEACDESCRRDLAASIEARFVVGGEVQGKHDNYALRLWAADGYTGKTLAEVERSCDICGVTELANTMELAASALHTKLKGLRSAAAQVQVASTPEGATILVDGDPLGVTPRRLELTPGEHEIVVRARGYADARRRISTVGGVQERIDVVLVPRDQGAWKQPVGWAAIGAGVLAGVVGGVLIGLDGQSTDCEPAALRVERCASVRDTSIAGGVVVGLGLAAVGAGVYFVLSGRPVERADVALVPSQNGVRMLGQF